MNRTDFTNASLDLKLSRLKGIIDDVGNEIKFSMRTEAALAVSDLLNEARAIVNSIDPQHRVGFDDMQAD